MTSHTINPTVIHPSNVSIIAADIATRVSDAFSPDPRPTDTVALRRTFFYVPSHCSESSRVTRLVSHFCTSLSSSPRRHCRGRRARVVGPSQGLVRLAPSPCNDHDLHVSFSFGRGSRVTRRSFGSSPLLAVVFEKDACTWLVVKLRSSSYQLGSFVTLSLLVSYPLLYVTDPHGPSLHMAVEARGRPAIWPVSSLRCRG
ncbi:hypothetical protein IWX48DRAFT_353210 [Phyllosticta citricarpa]